MPPKKGFRKSFPAQINNSTLSPSRRSPRVPTPSKSLNQTARSTKALDLTTASPPDNSYNLHLYTPKTATSKTSTKDKIQNGSSDAPLTRRRTFQAQPSRLSNVYTPAKETPKSISTQGSRKTRRTTALETPNNQTSDQEFSEGLETTGWSMAQYTGGGLNYDNSISDASPTSASSVTRLSSRARKPTTRAIEALDSKKKPRKKRATDTTTVEQPTQEADIGPNKIKRKGMKGKRASKIFKQMKQKKPSPLKIKLGTDEAGQKLYEIVVVALNTDFALPTDPEQFIANAREEFQNRLLAKSSDAEATISTSTSTSTPNDPAATETPTENAGVVVNVETNGETNAEKEERPTIKKLKKTRNPLLQADGWARAGYVNGSGEEVVLSPPGQSLYRAPHTYADENLPFPPVISRSERQIEKDHDLGFPPLIGDRNIPIRVPSEFSKEDVTEEKARIQAHKRKRSEAESERVQKARRRLSSKVVTNGVVATEEKPKIQRLKLKLKPPTESEREAGAVSSMHPPPALAPAPTTSSTPRATTGRGRGRGRGRGGTPRARGSARGGTPRGKPRGGAARGGSSRGATARGRGRGRGRGS